MAITSVEEALASERSLIRESLASVQIKKDIGDEGATEEPEAVDEEEAGIDWEVEEEDEGDTPPDTSAMNEFIREELDANLQEMRRTIQELITNVWAEDERFRRHLEEKDLGLVEEAIARMEDTIESAIHDRIPETSSDRTFQADRPDTPTTMEVTAAATIPDVDLDELTERVNGLHHMVTDDRQEIADFIHSADQTIRTLKERMTERMDTIDSNLAQRRIHIDDRFSELTQGLDSLRVSVELRLSEMERTGVPERIPAPSRASPPPAPEPAPKREERPPPTYSPDATCSLKGYCFRCQDHLDIEDIEFFIMRNHRVGVKGRCMTCGTKVSRILRRSELQDLCTLDPGMTGFIEDVDETMPAPRPPEEIDLFEVSEERAPTPVADTLVFDENKVTPPAIEHTVIEESTSPVPSFEPTEVVESYSPTPALEPPIIEEKEPEITTTEPPVVDEVIPPTPEPVRGYCLKCRMKVVMGNPEERTIRSGRRTLTGTCPECGKRISKLVR